ncbi:hypothetical protein LINPERPRIM_LOCUS5662, partial [Linum perenne]
FKIPFLPLLSNGWKWSNQKWLGPDLEPLPSSLLSPLFSATVPKTPPTSCGLRWLLLLFSPIPRSLSSYSVRDLLRLRLSSGLGLTRTQIDLLRH